MNRKTLTKIAIGLILGILTVLVFTFLSPIFHQEVPQNTIRILIDKPMDEHHLKLQTLMEEKNYLYVHHGEDFDLLPPDSAQPKLQFHLVRDENTRALTFLKGEADVIYDSLSFAKTEWIKSKRVPENARIYSSSGDFVSNLAMNTQSAALQNPDVKLAIVQALPLKLWTETVFFNWVELLQPENVEKREEILSKLHFPKGIKLRYLTTSSREGQQMAFLTREALKKIGIVVEIQVFEPSLFYAKIRKRDFDLFSSTSLAGTKNILDLPNTEVIPLFRWKHGLILNSRVIAPSTIETSLDYSFRFLSELKLH